MTNEYYQPTPRLSRWERFQIAVWNAYGVDAGPLVGTLASAFVLVVVLGVVFAVQL